MSRVAVREFGEGAGFTLDRFAGKPLVVNTWASWCRPCIAEMPDIQAVYEEMDGRAEFLGLNVRDGRNPAERLADRTGVRYPLASDPDAEAFNALGANGMPTTLFVNGSGRIVHRHTGPLTRTTLRRLISEHLGV